MDYSFNLDWNELPENLKEQKIYEVLESIPEEDRLEDEDEQIKVIERDIEAHFPIYF